MNPIRSALLTAKRPRQFAGGGKAGVIERAAAPAPQPAPAPAPEPAPAQAADVTPQPANVPLPPQKPAYLQSFDYSKYDNPLEARYNFLSKSLNPTIAAAALGNFGIESWNNPNQFQTRTGAPEGEPLYDKNNMPLGYGSAQWGGTRLTNPANDPNKMGLFDFAKEYGFDPNSTEGQDRFMVYELTQNPEYAGAYKDMQAAGSDLNKVTSIFGSDYESPANLGKTLGDRQVTAQMFQDYFNNPKSLTPSDQSEVSKTIMGMMSDPMFQSYAANKNNATDVAAVEDTGPTFTQPAALDLSSQQDAINAAQQAAVQQSQNFDTGIVQNAATDFNYLNPLQNTGIGDFTNMYTGIDYTNPVIDTPTPSVTDLSYNAFDNSSAWSFAVGGATPYVPPRKNSWVDRTNKNLQEEVLSPEKEDEASEYYQKWQREGSPKQRGMFAHGGDVVGNALRLARGGYADGGDPPEDDTAQPGESLLMREAVTPRSLAQSWTPPEEAIAAKSPIAADFMAQYPQKMGEAAVNTFKYPGQLLYGEKELNPEEAVDWANTAAGIAMTGGIGGVPVRAGEAVLGSGPVRKSIRVGERELPIRPSTDDLHEVMDASTTVGRAKPKTILPIEKLEGGVDLSDPKQRARVDALKEKMMGDDGHISRIIVDQDGNVVEGQHRFQALRELGAKEVPVEQFEDLAANINMGKLGADLDAAQRMGGDQRNSLINHAFDVLKEEGSVSAIRENYDAPRGYEKGWNAILDHLEANMKKTEPQMSVGPSSLGSGPIQKALTIANEVTRPAESRIISQAGEHGFFEPQSARERDPRLWHPISNTVLSRPLGEMTAEHQILAGAPERKFVRPEDLEGASLIPALGDRTVGNSLLTKVNDIELKNPVNMQAGHSFMYGPASTGADRAIWASDPGVISILSNKAKAASEAGFDPYLSYVAMGSRSGDYSHHMADTLREMMAKSKVSKDVVAEFDKQMRENTANKWAAYEDWPGLKSKNLEEYLYSTGPSKARTKMAELMGQGQFQKAGMPDVGAARFAITDPELLHAADYSAGRTIARLDPMGKKITEPAVPHKTYKHQLAAHPEEGYVGGFEYDIPFQVMNKEFIDSVIAKDAAKAANPSQLAYTYRMNMPRVDFNPQVVDRLSDFLDKKKRGLIP